MTAQPSAHATAVVLGFDRPVSPGMVNRRSPAEVLATDSCRSGLDEFAVAVRIPPGHRLWSDAAASRHDTVATIEVFRQAFALVRHKYLNILQGTPSAVRHLRLHIADSSLYREAESASLDGIARIRVSRAGPRSELFDITGTFSVGAVLAARVSFGSVLIPRASYDEIRAYQRSLRAEDTGASSPTRPVAPALVGRRDPRNVVIGRTSEPDRFRIVVDPAHPSFFDRDCDHIPGSLLIEAMRQSALVTAADAKLCRTSAAVVRAELEFANFLELDAPAECTVSVHEGWSPRTAVASIEIHQYGKQAAAALIEIARPPYAMGQ